MPPPGTKKNCEEGATYVVEVKSCCCDVDYSGQIVEVVAPPRLLLEY